MDKFKYIEDNLLELVKGCINDKDFMTNPIILDSTSYIGNNRIIRNITGVRIDNTSVITKTIERGDYFDKHHKLVNIITLTFENEPPIVISCNHIDTQVKNLEVKTLVKTNPIKKFFFGDKYEIEDERITTVVHQYELVCGEFKIALTDEQVDELVKLYRTNISNFQKEKEAFEIHKRIKKFVK